MGIWPKVSIILVNYNGYRDTIECLQSLRKITYPNHEVVVIDNASTNESVEEIGDFIREGEILIPSEVNGGFSAGNNIGIKYALEHGAEYCLLLNNDTVVEPNFLYKLINGFEFSGKCGLTIGKILYESKRELIWYAGGSLSPKTARTEHWHYRKKDEGLPDIPQKVTFATGCCMCLSRKTIDTVGLMDESYFLYEEDADYCYRITKAGFDMVYVPQARIYHKVSASTGEASVTSQYYTVRNKYRLIKRHYSGLLRYYAMAYCTGQYIHRCLSGKMSFGVYREAYSAYRKSEMGRVDSNR